MCIFTISYFWNGDIKKYSFQAEKFPTDKDLAETLAWAALRKMFEDRNEPLPDFIRNVSFEDIPTYQWDKLYLL